MDVETNKIPKECSEDGAAPRQALNGATEQFAWLPAAVEPKQLAVVRLWSTWSLDPHAAAELSARCSRSAPGPITRRLTHENLRLWDCKVALTF